MRGGVRLSYRRNDRCGLGEKQGRCRPRQERDHPRNELLDAIELG